MDNAMKLQMTIKRKTVLKGVIHGTSGYKVKECKVTYIENGWYHFIIDGYTFDCRWASSYNKKYPTVVFFRNNEILEKAGYNITGIDLDKVKNASSLYFGFGCDIIKILWVLGEVLEKKKSWEYC